MVRATRSKTVRRTRSKTAGDRLETFLSGYTAEIAGQMRACLVEMRAVFPGTQELVYDNYNALAIGWSPTGRTSDVICSLAAYPRWVSLFFFRGATLPDPDRRLKGNGKAVRHVVLDEGLATLRQPAIRALVAEARRVAPAVALDGGVPTIVIKSVSPKQRPRRPTSPPSGKRRARRA